MKSLYLLLILAAIVLTGCNYEAPTAVTPDTQASEVKTTVQYFFTDPANPDSTTTARIAGINLPMIWCPALDQSKGELHNPWVTYIIDGKVYEEQNPSPRKGFEQYFHTDIWYDYNKEVTVFIRYGNYKCDCNDPTKNKTALVCPTSKYAIDYNVTSAYDILNKISQRETILAFKIYHNQIFPISKNIIKPLTAKMFVPEKIIKDQKHFYRIDNTECTEGIGVDWDNNVEWTFPDGTVRNGWQVYHTLSNDIFLTGWVYVKITDNFGKYIIIKRYYKKGELQAA